MSYEVYTYGAYNFILLFVILCTARDDRSELKHVQYVRFIGTCSIQLCVAMIH